MLWWRAVITIETVFFGQFKMEYQILAIIFLQSLARGLVRSLRLLPPILRLIFLLLLLSIEDPPFRPPPRLTTIEIPFPFYHDDPDCAIHHGRPPFIRQHRRPDDEHRQHQTHTRAALIAAT